MAESSSILIASRSQRPTKYGALTRGSQPFQKFSIHKLRPNDTITGLAVKYGVAVSNHLYTLIFLHKIARFNPFSIIRKPHNPFLFCLGLIINAKTYR